MTKKDHTFLQSVTEHESAQQGNIQTIYPGEQPSDDHAMVLQRKR